MRLIVTPSFSEKVVRSDANVLRTVSSMLKEIEAAAKEDLLAKIVPVVTDDDGLFVFRKGDVRILLSFGSDAEGEYALLADLIASTEDGRGSLGSGIVVRNPRNDPKRNPMVDPDRNAAIDPRRNVMIDPSRNVMVDPARNVMLDPRRNVMIDPRRNVMIDPNRNAMIDPRRNYSIDPKRNWLLDPRKNSAWDGPYVFARDKSVVGFLVRASSNVALLFNHDADYLGPVIPAGENYNVFDTKGIWAGFLVSNRAGGFNRFDAGKRWIGYVVGQILSKEAE